MHHPSDVVTEVEAARQAIEALREQGHQTPRNAQIHLDLARHYRKLGNTIMSAQEYQITISIDPRSFEAFLELGGLYRDLRHWDLSIRALRKAVGLRPEDAGAAAALGDVNFEVHNHDEALAAYRAALRNGLAGEDRARVEGRLKDLEAGKFLIEELPRARVDGGG
jgi:tetratricopeptide (TPR) repeat protein